MFRPRPDNDEDRSRRRRREMDLEIVASLFVASGAHTGTLREVTNVYGN